MSCAKTERSLDELVIVYSGNIGGKIEPCGCNPPLGGMPRRATVIKALRNQYKDILVLDSGGLLYDSNLILPPHDFTTRTWAGATIRAMSTMGTDAINVSAFDLAQGLESLQTQSAGLEFPWRSANLTRRDTGELVFPADTTIVRVSLRIGIFGVMADNYRGTPLFKDSNPLAVADPFEAAAREVKKLKNDCDIIIALAYMSEKEVEKLATSVDGITLILHSHNGMHYPTSETTTFQPYIKGNSLVVHTPDGGRLLGVLELAAVDGSFTFKERKTGLPFEQKTEENRKLLMAQGSTYLNSFFSLGAEIVSDSVAQAFLDEVEPIITAYTDSFVTARE